MPPNMVRREIPEYHGLYFITFTCSRWLNLFEITQGYDAVYKWFDYLKDRGHYIIGYVIMPNHIHALIAFRHTQGQSINAIVGNAKRFMSYALVKKLQDQNQDEVLRQLASFVNPTEKLRGKLHEVFEPSFDWKECVTDKFIEQKVNYIHENPCRGKWSLANEPKDYKHSSAFYYQSGQQGEYPVTSFAELDDIDLSIPKL
jgi:REP element-mobilizing transposase RayT